MKKIHKRDPGYFDSNTTADGYGGDGMLKTRRPLCRNSGTGSWLPRGYVRNIWAYVTCKRCLKKRAAPKKGL